MARNGSGTYSLPESAFVNGTVISETAVNSNFSDIATALTASIARDGQTPCSARIPFANGILIPDNGTIRNGSGNDVLVSYSYGAVIKNAAGDGFIGFDSSGYCSFSHSTASGTIRFRFDDGESGSGADAVVITDNATASGNHLTTYDGGLGGSPQHRLSRDGSGYCDGAWTGGGADYAEYFEWADANFDNLDRRGLSVAMASDGKIRPAIFGDDPIGVISARPSTVGNNPTDWQGRFQKDDFGAYLVDSDGNRIQSESYDPNLTYVLRSKRREWGCVGLLGQLWVLNDQPIGSRWVKLRAHESAPMTLYLVR